MDDLDYVELTVIPSLVPGPPLFFILRFAFSIIHGSGKARKMGKAWEHHHVNDVRWMRGGRRGEGSALEYMK